MSILYTPSSLQLGNVALYTRGGSIQLVARTQAAGPHSVSGCFGAVACTIATIDAVRPSRLRPSNRWCCAGQSASF